MANDCVTDTFFVGNEDKLEKLYNDIKGLLATKREGPPNSWVGDPRWIGYLYELIGGDVDECPYQCKGGIEWADLEGSLLVTTTSAWAPCRKIMKALADKYEVKMYYVAEEPGSEVYEAYDPDHLNSFCKWKLHTDFIDKNGELNNETEYYDEDELIKALEGIVKLEKGMSDEAILEAVDDANEELAKDPRNKRNNLIELTPLHLLDSIEFEQEN